MDERLKETFIERWNTYFPGADLPIAFFYSDDEGGAQRVKTPKTEHRCVIADIARVRTGRSLAFDIQSLGCFGGKRYLGFSQHIMPNFEYFLSYGIPGELEGERYKKTPHIVKETYTKIPFFEAPKKYIVFKRWDKLEQKDDPVVVIFFASPDVLSGVFTLSNYDEAGIDAVYSPFGAGCATIVQYPYLENSLKRPRAVLGMFDVSARPCVSPGTLTIAVPIKKFVKMVGNMEECFLITESWKKVKKRITIEAKKKESRS